MQCFFCSKDGMNIVLFQDIFGYDDNALFIKGKKAANISPFSLAKLSLLYSACVLIFFLAHSGMLGKLNIINNTVYNIKLWKRVSNVVFDCLNH